MLTKNGKNSYRTLGRCAFATILCSLLFAASCGDDSSSSSGGESCTKNATKCGEGADANKLYTCTDEATFDKGVDCAANDSHKVCGGDTVKACVCDTKNGYVDKNGTCEKSSEDTCTKGSTKCGEGADANKLYTCTDEATFDKGVDCAANDSHKVCGGDTVKACVCDTQNNYVDINGTCEAKKQCDDEIHKYNPETNKCDCDPEKAVLVKDQCEKRQVCDADGQKYVEASNTCACDDEKYWTEGDDGCVCDEHRVNRSGVCECDDENHWTEGSDGSCVCDKIFFNDQCFEVQGTVTFGNYPQATETPEPIEWIVLAHQDNKLLLLSKYVIDARAFDESHPSEEDPDFYLYPTWAKSDIRTWLNDAETGFMSDAFSSAEQAMIAEVTNSTTGTSLTSGGEDSNDKVFLLDYEDAKNTDYFKDGAALVAKATAYIVGKACLYKEGAGGCKSNHTLESCPHLACTAEWSLRSPKSETEVRLINFYYDAEDPTGIYANEADVASPNIGIRPALWVSLSSEF